MDGEIRLSDLQNISMDFSKLDPDNWPQIPVISGVDKLESGLQKIYD